jgi:Galactose mutarotase and related enzymes
MIQQQVKSFTLENRSGAKVVLCNVGAGIISVVVPDKDGRMADVALGYGDLQSYFCDGPCMGKVPGRYANRIAGGKFTLDGKEYSLAINNGPNHLHGGPGEQCYASRIWHGAQRDNEVFFTLESPDGDAGYPGKVRAEAHYSWSEDNVLTLELMATSDARTIINLTNHAYFNLKGESAGNVGDHKLMLYASRYLPTDETLIPTGEMAPVKGTPMDFTESTLLGSRLHDDFPALNYGKGYDNCFVVDDYIEGTVRKVAELTSEEGGRKLTVSTDAPGIQIYTGNWLSGCPKSKSGKEYQDYDGVALECQAFPDSPNRPHFPFKALEKGGTYRNTIIFDFKSC